jgi:sulfur transfer protein SufE
MPLSRIANWQEKKSEMIAMAGNLPSLPNHLRE